MNDYKLTTRAVNNEWLVDIYVDGNCIKTLEKFGSIEIAKIAGYAFLLGYSQRLQ